MEDIARNGQGGSCNHAKVDPHFLAGKRFLKMADEQEEIHIKVDAEQHHKDRGDHFHRRAAVSANAGRTVAETAGARRAKGGDQGIVPGQTGQAQQNCLHHGKHQVHGIQDLGGIADLAGDFAHRRPRRFGAHQVHGAAIADRQNRHGKHQYAHAAHPVGKAAPEQHTVTHGFHIAQDAGAGGGKAGYRFKKGIHKKRDIAADDKRQRTEHGHQHPGQCHDHKTLARIDRRVGGAAQPQNKAQHGQPHRRYHKGKQAAPLAMNNSYNRRGQQQGGFNHKNTAQHIPKHAVVHSVTPLP